MASSMLCGCSKKSSADRSSMYVVSSGDEVTAVRRPPTTTTMNDVTLAPAAIQRSVSDWQRPARRGASSGREHVERYVVGGGTAVTVSVRHHQRHQNDKTDNIVIRHLSSYDEPVLYAAMATQDANISNHSGKVHATLMLCSLNTVVNCD